MTSFYPHQPETIAHDSFTLIRQELQAAGYRFASPLADIVERIVHSTADFEFAELLRLSPGAIEAGLQALRQGCALVCDVNMVRVGVSAPRLARLGGSLHCFVAEPEVRARAEAAGTTRSAAGIRLAADKGLVVGGIVVIGNAPTALFETLNLVAEGHHPALIVGVPVGFVSTVESKAALMALEHIPWLVTTGRKGGSSVAVAIINALLRLATEAPATEVD
jgi:precorrin-8X/cobalt-precorrin-8 methylmutase